MSRNDYSSGMVELRIPAKAEYIQLVRTVIGEVASINPNLNLGRIADLRLAVSEAVTNAYREHTRQNIEDQIVIRCDLTEGKIEIEINVERQKKLHCNSKSSVVKLKVSE